MPHIEIKGIAFNTEDLSIHQAEAWQEVARLEVDIADIKNEISVLRDAQNFYSKKLMDSLKKSSDKK